MNSDDKQLLKGLAEVAREQQKKDALVDKRWDALAAGKLPEDEVRKLEAMARKSPEDALLLEACRPFDQDFLKSLQQRALNELNASRAQFAPSDTRDNVVDISRRKRFKIPLLALSSAAAAAAAVALLVLVFSGETQRPTDYSLELKGHVRLTRGEGEGQSSADIKRFAQGSRLSITLRPLHAVEHSVLARLFFENADGVRTAELPMEIDEQGAVRFRGVIGRELSLSNGDWTAWIILGWPETLATIQSSSPQRALATARADSKFRVLSAKFHIEK